MDSNLGLTLRGDITKGKIHAALIRDGILIEYLILTPCDGMYVEFDSPNYGDSVTIMWLEDNLRPLCPAEKLTLK